MSFSSNFFKKLYAAQSEKVLENLRRRLELDPNDLRAKDEYERLLDRTDHPDSKKYDLVKDVKKLYPDLNEFHLNIIMSKINNVDEENAISMFQNISKILNKKFNFSIVIPGSLLSLNTKLINSVFPGIYGISYLNQNKRENFKIVYIDNGFTLMNNVRQSEYIKDTNPTIFYNPFSGKVEVGLIHKALEKWVKENFGPRDIEIDF